MLGPIFTREVRTVPRRGSHYVTRVAYLGALWVIAVTAALATLGWSNAGTTLGATARFGPLLFQLLSFVTLALFLFFSALTSASALAREKDRRTFILLLMTDLRDYEIVLGKMLGSMLPILSLQILTIPVFMLLVLLGGTAPEQILKASLVIAGTSLAAGSLGGLVALWRDRTFQSLALTVLFLMLYFLIVRGLGALAVATGLLSDPAALAVQEWLEPFLAMRSAQQALPDSSISPSYGFAAVMALFAVLLNGYGMWRLRVWNPSGEPIMQRETPEQAVDRERELTEAGVATKEKRISVHAAPGETRQVTGNPILWREVHTRAYGRRPLLVKLAYGIVLALILYTALVPVLFARNPSPIAAAYGLLPVAVLSLLLVAAQATTSITSERDTGALDLLLVTDLSPKEFIFGKLLGIAYNTKEFLIPPLMLAGVYAYLQCLATPPHKHEHLAGPMNATALICVLLTLGTVLTFASVLGIHVALRTQNSQQAIIRGLSTVFFLTVGTLICIALIVINRRFEYQWGSFLFFLIAGIGGLWYVLSGDRPSAALTWASWVCPLAVLYAVMNVLVGKPGSRETADPLIPALVVTGAFGFAIAAMLVPMLSEFDVAMGRTSGGAD